ncbi:hypothetical protein F5144DRAFT_393815 [Chaetomium tenue]|uniref:Uncharacterized protein n=1 Tax=Chaetomium tenue TaxID=1854479 RepID=A0ACB7NZZ1_9PEZI|nr:hypothetical protein F5144DRAFT_393815 [Chaetomium globosum]
MQFMSQSTGWFDNIVLAMAPLGIITAIVGAIRVGIIGRARKSRAVVEAELMSSTSHEVCELWNGQQIVRVMGRGPIREFIILLPDEEPASQGLMQRLREWFARPAEQEGVDSFDNSPGANQEATRVILKEDEKQTHLQQREPTIRERVFGERFRQTKNAETGESLNDDSVFVLRNTAAQAPNLTLDVRNQLSRGELYFVAVVGIILQLGVLAFSACVTYVPAFILLKDGKPVAAYAYPCTAAGTLLLVVGVLICSHVVENSTEEATYFPGPSRKARVIWLQRARTVSNQAFESFAIFPQEAQVLVRTSQRAPEVGPQKPSKKGVEKANQMASDGASSHSVKTQPFPAVLDPVYGYLTSENIKTIGGTAVGLCGFVVQFTGLRGMHWSASVAQLGATVLMTILRAWVRRNLAELPRALPIVPGHELDWLAMTFGGKSTNAPRRQSPEEDGKWNKDSRPWAQGDGWDWETVTIRDPADLETLQPHNGESFGSQSTASRVVQIRRDLGKLADWHGPASTEAIMLARSIEIAMDTLLGDLSGTFTWPLKVGNEEIRFRVHREAKGWRTYADEIEAGLSLWLYSVENKERRRIQDGTESLDGDEWLRSKETSAKPSLRLIGPFTKALHQVLRWWMPDAAARVVKAQQTSTEDASTTTFEAHRVVGFVASLSSQSPRQAGPARYMLEPLGEDSGEGGPSEDFNEDSNDSSSSETPEAANAMLAVESYNPMATLFAQHIFSSFMWAAAKKMEDKNRMSGKVDLRPKDTDGVSNDASWQLFTLHNTQLSAMAQDIQSTGLGTLEEVYLCIIPPLGTENKLPQPDSIIDWTRAHAERYEKRGHWKEACDAYAWLFRITKSTQGQDSISIKALALFVEFLMVVTETVNLRDTQKLSDDQDEELSVLESDLLHELRSHILDKPEAKHFISVLMCLMWLFGKQRRPWKYPFGELEMPKIPPDNMHDILGLTRLHRLITESMDRLDDYSFAWSVMEKIKEVCEQESSATVNRTVNIPS